MHRLARPLGCAVLWCWACSLDAPCISQGSPVEWPRGGGQVMAGVCGHGFPWVSPTDQLTSCVLARSGSDRPSHAVDIVTVRMPVVMTGPETASLHQP